jgi:hypothetical protein
MRPWRHLLRGVRAPRASERYPLGDPAAGNERDLEEVPEELGGELSFIFVDDADELLRHALTPNPADARAGELRRTSRAVGSLLGIAERAPPATPRHHHA